MNSVKDRILCLAESFPITFKELPAIGRVAVLIEQMTGRTPSDKVAPGLFVGSSDSGNYYGEKFDCCISVASGLELNSTTHSFNLHPHDKDSRDEFDDAVETVRDAWKVNDSVLVHCHEGKERAPTVVAVVLAKEYGWSFSETIGHIQKVRPFIEPTPELKSLAREHLNEKQ